MITIQAVVNFLSELANPSLQESYDNAGLLAGNPQSHCTGIMCCLDVTEKVLDEAVSHGVNMVISHHPLIFKPLKTLVPQTNTERILIRAIKHDITLYGIHTNYDNVIEGVNRAFAQKIGLKKETLTLLSPLGGKIAKLFTYVPVQQIEQVKSALFNAGAGKIGLYDECSFQISGTGTFRPLAGSDPYIGKAAGPREEVVEYKLEVIFPIWLKNKILEALKSSHPYEEVAYEIILTENIHQEVGSGMIGEIYEPLDEASFLNHISSVLGQPFLRHSPFTGKLIKKIAICGGAGSFLTGKAIAAGADAFITADLKYHEFFDAEEKVLLVDAGHFETEIPAIEQLTQILQEKFPTFAVLQTKVITNPVQYFRK